MLTFAYDYVIYNQVIVTDGTDVNSFVYEFGKDQNIETSISESILLAEFEVTKKQTFIPTAI